MNELSLFDTLFNNTLDNVFNGYTCRTNFVPKVDVKETKDSYSLDMELPGRSENDVDIEIDRNTLTISSKKEEVKEEGKKDKDNGKDKWLIKERRYSSFSRSFQMPEDVDSESIRATFKNGILNVEMPRKALAAPKRIAIECA
ncbi:MAG: Hsp20/alpha crystallin family protein [Treponema sp.]|nr:Hsp20/alpha crystallin family protein [Treponema sp.]